MQLDRGTLREGQLVRWNQQKGFGFIRPSDGRKDVFAHITCLAGQDTPQIGSGWVFSVEADPNGRGLRVVKAVPATDQAGRHSGRTPRCLAIAANRSARGRQRNSGPLPMERTEHLSDRNGDRKMLPHAAIRRLFH